MAKKFEVATVSESSSATESPCPSNLVYSESLSSESETDIMHPELISSGQDSDAENWERVNLLNSNISSEDSEDELSLVDGLRDWALRNNVPNRTHTDLLKCLRQHGVDVPKDARTLMQTPRETSSTVCKKSGGDYIYLGIEQGIKLALKGIETNEHVLDISLNIDGLPIFSSRKIQLWPIQVSIDNIKSICNQPFVAGMFCGVQKPQDLDFLKDIVAEILTLSDRGVLGKQVRLKNIICDAPARALVKGIIQFNGRYGCDFCNVRGEHDGAMLFLTKGQARTDASFRSKENTLHHKRDTPFEQLNIDMIKQFPIDPMHCVDLGVTKRLMLMWKEGPLQSRISANMTNRISQSLVSIRHCIPYLFNRKPRGLEELKLWKATEFRTFLLYTGPVVLKPVLNADMYFHFLSLSVAMRILYSYLLVEQHLQFAEQLLIYFVEKSKQIYGVKFVSYNVHCLLHLSCVAEYNGSLNLCSAYRFENKMSDIKRSARGTGDPIVQICNRLEERKAKSAVENCSKLQLKQNVCYSLKNGKFAKLHSVHDKDCLFEVYTVLEPLFMKPCDSRTVGIYKGHSKKTDMMMINRDDVENVAMSIPLFTTDQTKAFEVALLPLIL